jgi:hypothetical protein
MSKREQVASVTNEEATYIKFSVITVHVRRDERQN